jgi:capsular exopolysaccharide synthesis family protein
LITSATLGEGKSTAAAFLALTVATLKKKTLVVDADLRRPAMHRMFDLELDVGLTEVCDESTALAQAYKQTSSPYLSVLTAGRLSRDPSTYFEGGHVARILQHVRPLFDFVIVDCAPVMPVADPLTIIPEVTGLLFVVKMGETHRDLVKQATDVLTMAKAPISGVLLNDVKGVLPYHYGHRYAYQYYSPSSR